MRRWRGDARTVVEGAEVTVITIKPWAGRSLHGSSPAKEIDNEALDSGDAMIQGLPWSFPRSRGSLASLMRSRL